MTYCLGIKIRDGLIGLSDGRITSGSQLSAARKVTIMGSGAHRFFIMNSGLRSVRDKTLAYLRRDMSKRPTESFASMLDAVNAFTHCLRQVAAEDKDALEASKLTFNLHAIIGGRLSDDREPTMFLVYPEGNWIEVDERTPYLSIGATAYGKPILDRALRYDTSMQTALKLAYLSFELDTVQFGRCRLPDRHGRHDQCRQRVAPDPVRLRRSGGSASVVEPEPHRSGPAHARRSLDRQADAQRPAVAGGGQG